MTETNLAQMVEATNDAAAYDTNIKYLLADKQILARILKYAVEEFKDMRIQTMCNLSENIIAMGIEEGMEKGIEKERINAIERLIKAGITKEQIVSFGYTGEEFAEAESIWCVKMI